MRDSQSERIMRLSHTLRSKESTEEEQVSSQPEASMIISGKFFLFIHFDFSVI
jgi:hypothetical protein